MSTTALIVALCRGSAVHRCANDPRSVTQPLAVVTRTRVSSNEAPGSCSGQGSALHAVELESATTPH